MKRKRILPIILSAAMVTSMMPVTAFAGTSSQTYTGSVTVEHDDDEDFTNYDLSVDLTLTHGIVSDVAVTGGGDENAKYVDWALNGRTKSNTTYKGLAEQLKGKTPSEVATMTVDTVSGATCTSTAILKAAQAALKDVEDVTVKYVMMNVPYDAFYAAYGLDDSAVWEVEDGLDAVSTATTNKFAGTTGLANGTYNNGKYIMGVTIPVAISSDVLATIDQTGLTANSDYYYTLCDTQPEYYSTVTEAADGTLEFSKMAASTVDTSQLSIDNVTTSGGYGDYQISLMGVGTNKTITTADGSVPYGAVYGVILNTDQGSFGMTTLENIWVGQKTTDVEVAWSIVGGQGLKRGHGSGGEFYQFAMNGGTLESVDVITDLGVITINDATELPSYYTDTEKLANLTYAIDNDSTELSISGVPEDLEDVTVSVSGGLATNAEIKDGKVTLTKAPTAGTSYTLTINSSNYSAITRTMSTPISKDQKTELNKWVEKAKETTGYNENNDLKDHVAEAEALLANPEATSVDAASLIKELQEKVKATYASIQDLSAKVEDQKITLSMGVDLSTLENPTYTLTSGSGRGMRTIASGDLASLEISLDEALAEHTAYTLTVKADNCKDTAIPISYANMQSTTVAGTTYYYVDTTNDADSTVYHVSVTTGRGPSAKTTVYDYTKSQLTQVGDSNIYAIVAPGATEVTGTLYGYASGTASNYKSVYSDLNVTATDDPAYDCVTSATTYTSYHAKDISSVVTYGTDSEGNKAITGLNLNRVVKTVDAAAYVPASILKAAGVELTEEQSAALDIQLKAEPTKAPEENTVEVKAASAAYVSESKYGSAEFDIVPDDTVEGYVWNEYWDNMYAATISDGTTTVGAVHWIDMYGESATSGYHYNKVQLALNNGTSIAANEAEVSRYAAFYDENTGNLKAGTYTITLYSEGYTPLTVEVEVAAEAMKTVTVAGTTYYYADTTGDAEGTVYQASVTTGRGPSASTTVYNYTKSDLTQMGDEDSSIYAIVAPGAEEVIGTLYGYDTESGTATNYTEVYKELDAETDDDAYDCVTSATTYTSYHAKDISSVVTYGTDSEGNKAITGLNLNRTVKTVDAEDYVPASILKAAGVELTEEQSAALDIQLKANPTKAPEENTVDVKLASATYVSDSKYGTAEFDIVPDDTVEGYVWNEYWDSMYAATISDGTTTVGAVHWIDMYGESATSGYHYNKVQLALNNGTSIAANEAEVSRYAAFYNEKTGALKNGTYTITLYSEGYSPLEATVTVNNKTGLSDEKAEDGNWYYLTDGQPDLTFTGVAKNVNGWYYVKDGKVDFTANTIAKNPEAGTWWKVTNGKVDFGFTGVAKNENGWWYCQNGKVDFSANTVAKNPTAGTWWKVTSGKVDFTFTGVAKNANGWWYCQNGKVDFTANTVAKNPTAGTWWKVTSGKVDFSFTGLAKNANGWWYCQSGKVNFSYTGIVKNSNGTWYVKGGKVQFNFSGKVKISGKTYTIVKGKVK